MPGAPLAVAGPQLKKEAVQFDAIFWGCTSSAEMSRPQVVLKLQVSPARRSRELRRLMGIMKTGNLLGLVVGDLLASKQPVVWATVCWVKEDLVSMFVYGDDGADNKLELDAVRQLFGAPRIVGGRVSLHSRYFPHQSDGLVL